jgi:Tol biopolymer transport system component
LATAGSTLDLSHTTVGGLSVISTNALGTAFTVGDLGTAFQIAGGAGQDTITALGFVFTPDQRNTIFATASVEKIVDQSGTYTVNIADIAPTITSNGAGDTAAVSILENTTAVTTVTATDPDAGQTLAYSITGGADAGKFTIGSTTGALSFITAPNFELPTDAGGNNVYDVIVQASDGHGGTDTQAVAVTVTDVVENSVPTITSNGGGNTAALSIAENATAVTTVTATDPDSGQPLSYSISGGADAGKFAINAATGALSFVTAPNFEAPTDTGGNNVYDVTVQVSDGHGGIDTQAIAVTVTDHNEAPTFPAVDIIHVSTDANGNEGNGVSFHPSISADGRYVAFASTASNLVPGDTNGTYDVFVRDLQTGSIARVSTDVNGGQSNGNSFDQSISADGRYVAFTSGASNLVPGDTNGSEDVFVRDLQTDAITRVSTDVNGGQGNGRSSNQSISADGRYVTFTSLASNLVPGDTDFVPHGTTFGIDVFVKDLQTGAITCISTDANGKPANQSGGGGSSISADGRYVAFTSDLSNLVPGDANHTSDVFVKDLQTGSITCISTDADGDHGNEFSVNPSISADGRYVVFYTASSNLVPGDTNNTHDVFVRDLQTGSIARVSTDVNGGQGNGASFAPSISADGRYVAFTSDASNLVPGDTNGSEDMFVRDLQTGAITRVSPDDGRQGVISADGRYVAFNKDAFPNSDVFVAPNGFHVVSISEKARP